MLGHLAICPDPLLKRPCLDVADMFPANIGLHVLGKVSLVRRHQKVVQRNRVRHKFDYSRVGRQRKHLVGSNAQVSLSRRLVVLQKTADLLKHLFHDRVLSQVVVSSLELLFVSIL
jgi:hypothetical protein